MPLARAGGRPPVWSSPAREGARSPPAPQTRDTGRRAAALIIQTSMVACRLPSETIVFLPPATHRVRPQHPHSSCLPQSPPRTVAAHLDLPPTVDLVRTMAPDQTDPNAACASSSQPPSSRCCDDRLSLPCKRQSAAQRIGRHFAWDGEDTACGVVDDESEEEGMHQC